jgi:Carboxypeptidase regulatory-like domain
MQEFCVYLVSAGYNSAGLVIVRAILCGISILAALFTPAFAQDSPSAPAPSSSSDALLDGSVVNKISGAPVKRAHVMIARLPSPGADDASQTFVDTDANGRFTVRVAPGQYRIWVERLGFSRLNYGASSAVGVGKTVTLQPGQELHDLSFPLSPLGAISGHVVDEDGDPIQGAGVQVLAFSYGAGKRTLLPVSGTSSNDRGEYRAFGLPPGRYFLLVSQPNAPPSHASHRNALVADPVDSFAPLYYPGVLDFSGATPIVLGEGAELPDVDIRLQRIRVLTVRGRIVSPVENFAATQLQAVLVPRDQAGFSYLNRTAAVVNPVNGRFEFHGVAPGSYLAIASQLDHGRVFMGRLPLEITAAGRADEISIPLAAASEMIGTVDLEGASPDLARGARVLLSDSEGLALGPQPSAPVSPTGAFQLPGVTVGLWELSLDPLPKGTWVKNVIFNGRETPSGLLEITASAPASLRIVLASNAPRLSGTVVRDGQPCAATVLLAPAAPELRALASKYLSMFTDDQGNFSFSSVRPGAYELFAFDDIEPYAWLDPDFLRSVESSAREITLSEGDDSKQQLSVISLGLGPARP